MAKEQDRKQLRLCASGSAAFSEFSSGGSLIHPQNTGKCYVQFLVDIRPGGRNAVTGYRRSQR